MSKTNLLQREHSILCNLSKLPGKILSQHNHDNITELVLHELCGKECFNLDKAAYFVDNPDFNCLKGVAGFSQIDVNPQQSCDVWENPNVVGSIVRELPFNKKVRTIERCSLQHGVQAELGMAKEIAQDLGMLKPQFCLWAMKNENHGLLIFEKGENCEHCPDDYVVNGCSLLGFCPIY